ncbi:lipoyl(octanoyl) transferase LipB [bacterium]|nr:MAG: lipoyl(octanoyl) transferase LipB [bacterium]
MSEREPVRGTPAGSPRALEAVSGAPRAARLVDLGRMRYGPVLELQRRLHAARVADELPDTWLLVEHDPVITLGRNAQEDNLLLPRPLLERHGVEVFEIERGGDVTYHGPGQLVVYPIRKLARFREIVPLVRSLEGAVIEALATFGITGERWSEHAGVWVHDEQICAVGLAVQKMVSLHGIALNVSTDLSYPQLINPCGLPDRGVTSIARETGRTVSLVEAKRALVPALGKAFHAAFVETPLADIDLDLRPNSQGESPPPAKNTPL